jgi:hypothetical protein
VGYILRLGWRPRTVQLCIRCHQNPAGFWVSSITTTVTRRPWCLSCCEELDQAFCTIAPFAA